MKKATILVKITGGYYDAFKIWIDRRFHPICAPLRVLQSQSRTKNKYGATFHQRAGADSIN